MAHLPLPAAGVLALLPLAALLPACAREDPPSAMALTSFRQAGADGVFLNETLVIHFDRDLDPASVTRRSVRILHPSGGSARGRLEVGRDQVRFYPDPPRDPDLIDGGLLPDTEYHIEVAGFPLPDAVRAVDGTPLFGCYRASFATVDAGAPLVFEDPAKKSRSLLLSLDRVAIGPLEGIRLTTEVPVDPTSLRPEDYALVRAGQGAAGAPDLLPVPLEVRLAENRSDGAVVLLLPRQPDGTPRALLPGEYQLVFDVESLALRDLGGRPVRPVWWAHQPWATLTVEEEPGAPRHREEFLAPGASSPEAVAEFDGTAHWSDSGAVRVRYPRAAGSGRDGHVVLDGEASTTDVHAIHLEVPEGVQARLPRTGLVVLRAQGRLDVRGRLVRTVEAGLAARGEREEVERWLGRVRTGQLVFATPAMEPALAGGVGLDSFLQGVAPEDPAWTVLVAGGDLVVEGEIVLDGPLLLAAGGRIRVPGRIEAREVWKVREGGGNIRPFVREIGRAHV